MNKRLEPDALASLIEHARDLVNRGLHAEAEGGARAAVDVAFDTGDLNAAAEAGALLVALLRRLGRPEEAIARARTLLSRIDGADHLGPRCRLLYNTAHNLLDLGMADQALPLLRDALESAQALDDQLLLSWVYNRTGLAYRAMKAFDRAEEFLGDALRLARQSRAFEESFAALNNLAITASDRADHERNNGRTDESSLALDRAIDFGKQAMALVERAGNAYQLSMAMSNLARFIGFKGDMQRAFELLDGAEKNAARHQHDALVAATHSVRCEVLVEHRMFADALPLLERSLAEAIKLADDEMVRTSHRLLYVTHKALGDSASALAHHERYHDILRQQWEQRTSAQARVLMGQLDLDRAQFELRQARMEADLQRVEADKLSLEAARFEKEARLMGKAAHEDPLTGLGNRRHLELELPRHVAHCERHGGSLSIAMLDADLFKNVNDAHGHAVGDEVLKHFARELVAGTRAGDVVARFGGEEFVAVLPATGPEAALEVCERLRAGIEHAAWSDIAPGLALTVSIGVASWRPGLSAQALLDRADAAAYEAKRRGRNRLVCAIDDCAR